MENKILNRDNIDIVMYHANCSDGFGSAFIVWLYFKQKFGLNRANNINYIPCFHLKKEERLQNDILNKLLGKNILMCDFSYPYTDLNRIIDVSSSFMLLDHHITAKQELKNVPVFFKKF